MFSCSIVSRARVLKVRLPIVTHSSPSSTGDLFTPEKLLCEEARQKCVQRLQQFKFPRPISGVEAKQAAVLVPLCLVDGEVSLLYTLRSPSLTTHSGQVAFPGGMKDDTDENSEATAIRETEEELGIPKDQIQIWGSCSPLSARLIGTSVVPVVASIGIIDLQKLRVNEEEVGEVFTIPLRQLCNIDHFRYTQFRSGHAIPVYLTGKHRVWGLTATITHIFLSSLLPSVYQRVLRPIKPVESIL